jgi:hypothetical protein
LPVIETEDRLILFVSYTSTYDRRSALRYVDLVKMAYQAMRRVVAARRGISIEEANTIVATACDIVNFALYGLGENYVPQDRGRLPYDTALVAALPKSVFVNSVSRGASLRGPLLCRMKARNRARLQRRADSGTESCKTRRTTASPQVGTQ